MSQGRGGGLLLATSWLGHQHQGPAWVVLGLCLAACAPAGLRWLRVAQREHYLAGSCSRFAARWWTITAANAGMAVAGLAAAVVSGWWPVAGVATAAAVAAGPLGLSPKGRTARLAWTRRLRTMAAVWAGLEVLVVVVGVVTGAAALAAVAAAVLVPALVDLACLVTAPVERQLGERFVRQATARLAKVAPTVVAITGSYGKTSTKGHVAHLVRGSRSVVATPASFNNRAGLARAVNEHLADGTQVFVAEMGTYGPGEIAELCRWCPPRVAVITAIGPVHLERFGSEDRIVEAKSEITGPATDVVLQADDPRLAALGDRLAAAGKHVVRCSTSDRSTDVCVEREGGTEGTEGTVTIVFDGQVAAKGVALPTSVQPGNLACALAVGRLLGVPDGDLVARVADLPAVDHRLQAVRSASGATLLDDTYNANPAGTVAALRALGTAADALAAEGVAGAAGRVVVVTPGMVELGRRQRAENERFGAAIAARASDLLVVGRTNRRALVAGATGAGAAVARDAQGGEDRQHGAARPSEAGTAGRPSCLVRCVTHREEAVAWVRGHLGPGDAVLYENDLPDHYP